MTTSANAESVPPNPAPFDRAVVPETVLASPQPATRRRGLKWLAVAGGFAVVIFSSAAVADVVAKTSARQYESPEHTDRTTVALQQWWSNAQVDFVNLQYASKEVQQALTRFKPGALALACEHMHDAAEVGVSSHLPSPDAELTAEIHAAIEDLHSAAHMCLAIAAGSTKNYDGEFLSSMTEVNTHLRAAQKIIHNAPMTA